MATLLALVAMIGGGNLLFALIQHTCPQWLATWWLVLPLDLAMWAVELALSVYVLSAWQHRWSWSQARKGVPAGSFMAGMRALLAFDLQFLWLSMLLFLPMMLCMSAVLDTSTHEFAHRHASDGTPITSSAFARASDFLVEYWWFGLVAIWGALQYWPPFTAKARTLRLLEP